jgi:enediyne biosynthesis protein E4
VPKFLMPRDRMQRSFNRRDFMRLGSLAAAAQIFPGFLSVGADAGSSPAFEIKPLRGVDFILQNSPTRKKFLIETMPGGVALFDYNNDGLLDIFFVNGGAITEKLHVPENFNRSNPRYWNRLYRQNRDGSFTDVTEAAGLAHAGNGNYGIAVAVGDYDNDGYPDLFVASYGKNILYHNNGDGTFTDVTAKAGVAGGGWSGSAGFFDYNNDGHLDLFVTRYMEWDADHNKICGGNWQTYCPPGEFPRTTCLLYRNRGDGTFEDVSERSGIAEKKGRALGVAFADYDDDGFTDIFVSNDGMQAFLYHNNGDGTFEERALESGAALSIDGKAFSGMGTVFQDYDNDGRPDIIVTVLPRQLYSVFHNDGGGVFTYESLETGLGRLTPGSSGWGVGLEDFDNDGWKDLFAAQSHVLDNVHDIDSSLEYKMLPLLAMNHKGHFELADSGVSTPLAARGAAFGDINNDGWMEVVLTILGCPPILLLNRGGDNHWLSITLQGTRSNRDGYGARVRVNGQTRFATSTGSYNCSNDKRLHFGLGDSRTASIEILWPSGARQTLKDVAADQFLKIQEPEHS